MRCFRDVFDAAGRVSVESYGVYGEAGTDESEGRGAEAISRWEAAESGGQAWARQTKVCEAAAVDDDDNEDDDGDGVGGCGGGGDDGDGDGGGDGDGDDGGGDGGGGGVGGDGDSGGRAVWHGFKKPRFLGFLENKNLMSDLSF